MGLGDSERKDNHVILRPEAEESREILRFAQDHNSFMPASGVWNFLQWVHYLAIVLWAGGITFLAGIAAPVIHRSMTSRSLAGELVGAMLRRFNMIEIVCWLVLLVTSISARHFVFERKSWLGALFVMVLVMGIFTCFYSFHLSPRMRAIKEKVPTLDALSANNPDKMEFDHLHKVYVKLMSFNLVLGLAVLYTSVVIFKL